MGMRARKDVGGDATTLSPTGCGTTGAPAGCGIRYQTCERVDTCTQHGIAHTHTCTRSLPASGTSRVGASPTVKQIQPPGNPPVEKSNCSGPVPLPPRMAVSLPDCSGDAGDAEGEGRTASEVRTQNPTARKLSLEWQQFTSGAPFPCLLTSVIIVPSVEKPRSADRSTSPPHTKSSGLPKPPTCSYPRQSPTHKRFRRPSEHCIAPATPTHPVPRVACRIRTRCSPRSPT